MKSIQTPPFLVPSLLASQAIHAMRHRFEVVRPHAGCLPAQVVNLGSFRDRADKVHVGPPMGENLIGFPVSDVQQPVAVQALLIQEGACPQPVIIRLLDVIPEPFLYTEAKRDGSGCWVTMPLPAAVVRAAQPSLLDEYRTSAAVHGAKIGGGWNG